MLTVRAARGGIWFAFFAATPAALGLGRGSDARGRLALPICVALAGLAVFGIAQGPRQIDARKPLVRQALAEAAGNARCSPPASRAKQIADAGGRIWIGNPFDAFSLRDQRVYVHWLLGEPAGDAALAHAPRVVLVHRGSKPQKRLARRSDWREAGRDDGAVLYVRSAAQGPAG